MYEKNVLGPLLGRAGHLCRERMDFRLSQYEVTPAQTHLLLYLYDCGGQAPQRAVTAYLRVRPSTANGILDRLEEKGMVTRSVSGRDARRRLITLTERGREQQERFRESFQSMEDVILRGFTPEEISSFYGMLNRVIQNLEEDRTYDEKTLALHEAVCEMDRRRRSVQRGGGGF